MKGRQQKVVLILYLDESNTVLNEALEELHLGWIRRRSIPDEDRGRVATAGTRHDDMLAYVTRATNYKDPAPLLVQCHSSDSDIERSTSLGVLQGLGCDFKW
jgi:hypothetical protein